MCVHGKARLLDARLWPLSQLGRSFRPTTHRTVPRGERDGAVARTRGWRHAMHRPRLRRVSWKRLQAACCRLHRVRRIGQEHGGCSGALFSVWTLALDNSGQTARRSPRGTWRRANDAPLMRCVRGCGMPSGAFCSAATEELDLLGMLPRPGRGFIRRRTNLVRRAVFPAGNTTGGEAVIQQTLAGVDWPCRGFAVPARRMRPETTLIQFRAGNFRSDLCCG
jgi:hypothetical protein